MTKKERAEKRKRDYELRKNLFQNEIDEVIKNSSVFCEHEVKEGNPYKPMNIIFQKATIAESLINRNYIIPDNMRGENPTILDFASYRKPGGGYLSGSLAQEEDLCDYSLLYPILKSGFSNLYKKRNNYTASITEEGKYLYTNETIFLPHVPFFFNEDSKTICDRFNIIVTAAPNAGAYKRSILSTRLDQMISYYSLKKINKVLRKRISLIITIANHYKTDELYFGAFGCGVFKNNPNDVAKILCDLLTNDRNEIKTIVMPIPDEKTLNSMKSVFENYPGNEEYFKIYDEK